MGLRTPPQTVSKAVELLSSGHRVYSLYAASRGKLPLVAKATAVKIARLLKEGKLSFLLDEARPSRAISAAYPALDETEAGRVARLQGQEQIAAEEVAEYMAGGDFALREEARNDPDRFHRYEVLDGLPSVDWTLAGLESAGIPEDKVLGILLEHDELQVRRVGAKITAYGVDSSGKGTSERPYALNFPGLERYVALHYLVHFALRVRNREGVPFALLDKAAKLYAKGVLSYDNRLQAGGEDIVRYEIWRGRDYLEAYFKAQERLRATMKRRERFRAEIRSVVDSIGGTTAVAVTGKEE